MVSRLLALTCASAVETSTNLMAEIEALRLTDRVKNGLMRMIAEDGLQPLVDRALAAAARRSEELAEAARRN